MTATSSVPATGRPEVRRPIRRRRWTAALIVALALTAAAPVPSGAEAIETARQATAALEAASRALARAATGRDRVAALTEAITAQERGLTAVRAALRDVALREAVLERGFTAREARLASLLAALTAVERDRGPLLLLHPDGPLGTARAGMLMAELAPALSAEAAALRAQLQEVRTLRALQDGARADLAAALAQLQEARTALSRAISDRAPLPRREIEDPATLAALASAAETLDALAGGIVPLAVPGAESGRFADRRGGLPLPVEGRLLRAADEPDAAGIARPGILLATLPEALLRAPVAVTVRFAGRMGDYGNVMLLEPAEDYLIVLSGLGTVYARPGEVLAEGAPLGLMPGAAPGDGTEASGTLYLELRHEGAPLDPQPWFVSLSR